MSNQALTAAINALATAITNGEPKKNILSVNFFNKDKTKDPFE
ncbi:35243_t:CDS:1, partial [Gigaspora margarita]